MTDPYRELYHALDEADLCLKEQGESREFMKLWAKVVECLEKARNYEAAEQILAVVDCE